MTFLRSADLGFTKDQQLVIPLRSTTAKATYPALKDALLRSTHVQTVGAATYYPGIFNPENGHYYGEGQAAADAPLMNTNRVDMDFLNTLSIRPVAGRLFSRAFPADTSQRIILNEQAVKAMGYSSAQSAIGKKTYAGEGSSRDAFTIIGVVKDFHFQDLHIPITPYGFTLNKSQDYNYLVAHVKAGTLESAIQSIGDLWQQLNPGEPFEYSFLDEDFQKNYAAESRIASVVSYFTIIAILISCLGLFGLAAFTAEQRTKEIGVRKVLGASVGSIVTLLSKDFLKLVLIAVVIASPIAWYAMNRWLQDFAYRINIEWWVFALAGLLAVGIALLTVSFQSVKAALMNPVKSLRSE